MTNFSQHEYLFTSESVTEGHPDKVADQISDGVLDAVMRDDPTGRVACETLVNTGLVVVSGEISTQTYVDIQAIARETIRGIGYIDADLGFSADSCAVLNAIDKQSSDIAQGVDQSYETQSDPSDDDELDIAGAGDQGMMFGYASNETPELMPLPIALAHKLAKQLAVVRHDGTLDYLRPDGKTQVSVRYVDGVPTAIEKLLISTQHADSVQRQQILDDLWETVVLPVLPGDMYDATALRRDFLVNPTGRFVIGGPVGDCGLTGRKIIVDSYGGMARHGGGAFSGKDPSKVDRSAAYAARWVAKNIVAAGLADRCEVQVAYAIGVAHPVSVMVETFGTEKIGREKIAALSTSTSICVRARSETSSICIARSIRRPPPTAISGATIRTSRGSRPARPTCCATPPASPRAPRSEHGHRRNRRRGPDGLGHRRGGRGRGPARARPRAAGRTPACLRGAHRGLAGKAVDRGKLDADAAAEATERIIYTTRLDDLAECGLVVEAVTEDRQIKCDVFRRLDERLPRDVILASNTSSIPITTLAQATSRPERVLGLHFFSPVPVMALVEIVPGYATSPDAIEATETFARRLGKHAIRSKDRAGFVVNLLLIPYLVGAIHLYDAGYATRENIDEAMTLGCGHPMGPLALCDFIGLDVIDGICACLHEEYGREEFAAPPLLRRMVAAGALGRKAGRGFYEYAPARSVALAGR